MKCKACGYDARENTKRFIEFQTKHCLHYYSYAFIDPNKETKKMFGFKKIRIGIFKKLYECPMCKTIRGR